MALFEFRRLLLRLTLLFSALVLFVNGQIDPVVIKGSRFFYEKSGSQFFIRALHISDSGKSATNSTSIVDVIADGAICERDIPYFIKLNINTLVVDGIDLTRDHDACMNQLANAGIFVIVYINGRTNRTYRSKGRNAEAWDYMHYERAQSIIDQYQKYPNTLGFMYYSNTLVGSIMQKAKATVVHLKQYIKENSYRRIPIGLEGKEDRDHIATTASSLGDFFNCGDKESSPDFLNILPFPDICLTKSSLKQKGLIEKYSTYSIPSIITTGCDASNQHDFTEVQDIFGENGSRVFAGAIFREWFEDWISGSDQGLVDVKGPNIIPRLGYYALSSQLAAVHPSSVIMQQYTPTNTLIPKCNKLIIKTVSSVGLNTTTETEIAPNLPSKPYQRLCSCMTKSLHCTVRNGTSPAAIREKIHELCDIGPANATACFGTSTRSNEGKFGSFVGCTDDEKVAWEYNQDYINGGWNSTRCSSLGGMIQTPSPTQASDCEILLRQAGPDGTGTVTYTPPVPTGIDSPKESKETSLTELQKIGISLGAVFTAILVAAFLLFRWFRRKRKAKSTEIEEIQKAELPDSSVEPSSQSITIPSIAHIGCELDGNEQVELAADVPHELEGTEKTELAADNPHELGGTAKHELDGNEKNESEDEEAIYELSSSPVERERKFSFDNDVDTIIKS